ncbi:Aro80p PWA37_001756 [Arxiozyma heterogenica]|uniref:Zn(2)-C6 fungal-type domain-containing protein n=1 Tax=Arxiozyma heterogenica TaxID=278026 RepID=A0AAN7WT10_9SACH|nr:hypothetical protein RI543_002416 [Kazachstania heterogenica]
MISDNLQEKIVKNKDCLNKNVRIKKLKWKRNYKACLNCRIRKVKCDLGPVDNPHPPPCERCIRQQRECLFTNTIRENCQTIVTDTVSINANATSVSQEIKSLNKLSDINNVQVSCKSSNEDGTVKLVKFPDREPNNLSPNDKIDKIKNHKDTSKQNLENNISTHLTNREDITDHDDFSGGKKWRLELASMQTTLQFLADAAGTVAKHNTVESAKDKLNKDNLFTEKSKRFVDNKQEPLSNNGKLTRNLHKSAIASLYNLNGPEKPFSLLIDKLTKIRPRPDRVLSDFNYIGPTGLLTKEEAVEFIGLYFSTMHPYFPNIPLQLHDPTELAQYPILLCAILTIATRYHTFNEIGYNNGRDNKRNIRVHEQLWDICQKLISQTIWAEASTRSIGTVLAFIIFTEWNPRQIHWKKADYANSTKEANTDKNKYIQANSKGNEESTGIGAIRRSDRMSWMLTGTAVRLAQDMGFLETSTKVFVAAHISDALTSMNMNQKSVLSESFSDISFERQKYRTITSYEICKEEGQTNIGNELFYLEQILKDDPEKEKWIEILKAAQIERPGGLTDLEREFLNDEYILYYSRNNDEIIQHQQQNQLPYPLKFSFSQRANIELVRIILIGYDTIYYDKGRRKLASNNQVHNLAVLNILTPLIEGWYDTYRECMKILPGKAYEISIKKDKRTVHNYTQQIMHESLLCDYYYCQLYIYSLALQVDARESKLRMNEITKSAKYVAKAYNAAKEILYSAVRVHKLKLLKYMPVKWVMRIVRAVSFLVKCYLTLTNSGETVGNSEARTILKLCCISLDETLNVIKLAAITLKEASPDELHLALRYSAILLYLCKEMTLKKEQNKKLLVNREIIIKENRSQDNSNDFATAPLYKINTKDNGNTLASTNKTNKQQKVKVCVVPNQDNNLDDSNTTKKCNMTIVEPSKSFSNIRNKNNADIMTVENEASIVNSSFNPIIHNNDNVILDTTIISTSDNPLLPDKAIDWFSGSTNIGLDFVQPWTEMLEQKYLQYGNTDFDTLDYNAEDIYNYFGYEFEK